MNHHVGAFTLLNVEGKRLIISRMHDLTNVIISILFFGSPSQQYIKGLFDIMNELAETVLLNDTSLLPVIKGDRIFLSILDKFNKLQKKEELFLMSTLNRVNHVDASCNDTDP